MIIAISGKKESGKDTVGSIIQYLTSKCSDLNDNYRTYQQFLENNGGYERINYNQHYQTDWQVKKFADKLKDIVCLLVGCTKEQLEDQTFKETALGSNWEIDRTSYGFDSNIQFTPRILLQQIGTELFRNQLHPDIWVNSLFSEYTKNHYFRNSTVWSPVTRAIESEYPRWIITDLRFKNEKKRIEEMGGITIRVSRFEQEIENEHPSETELDNEFFRYTILNEGTIEELIETIKDILIQEKII
jgi:hypothetical protein